MGQKIPKLRVMFNQKGRGKGGREEIREEMVDMGGHYWLTRLKGLDLLEELGEINDQVFFLAIVFCFVFCFLFFVF